MARKPARSLSIKSLSTKNLSVQSRFIKKTSIFSSPNGKWISGVLLGCAASQLAAAEAVNFDIPSQPLSAALEQFATQSHMQLLYRQSLVQGMTARGVHGNLDSGRALQTLLADTGLEPVYSGGGLATLRESEAKTPAPAVAANTVAAPERAGVEEVVVTAQRREERLQDVPIAVTVLNGDALAKAGISSASDLTAAVPGLNFARSSFSGQPTVRGVGTRNVSNGDEANVATYVDGVYQAKPFALFADLTDVDSVQVLKGPQGTLFGRNATGGAILMATREPSSTPQFDADATYGKFNYQRGHIYFNAPITDGIAFNTSLVSITDDGYLDDIVSGDDVGERDAYYVRSKLRVELGDTTALTLRGAVSRDQNDAIAANSALDGNSSARRTSPGTAIPDEPYEVASDVDNTNEVESKSFSYTLEFELGELEGSATGSYQQAELHFLSDSDRTRLVGSYNDISYDDDAWSQEFLLSSAVGDGFEWTAGAFFFSGTDKTDPQSVQPNVQYIDTEMKTKAYAVFGEATWQIGEQLYLTGGGRYSIEDRDYRYRQTVPTIMEDSDDASFNNFTPRVIARYEFSPDASVYGSYSKGFKSGIYNGNTANATPVDPEKIDAYEVGLKTLLLDGRLMFNSAAYYYDYGDLQVQTITTTGLTAIQNAAQTEIYGIDADFSLRVSPEFTVNGGVSWVHSRFEKFEAAQIYTPVVLADGSLGGNTSSFGPASGNQLIRTPDYTANLGAVYTILLPVGSVDLSGQAFVSGPYYLDVQNRVRQDSYVLLNANMTWHSPDERWEVGLYGENLADEERLASLVSTARGDGVSYQRPRSYGVRVGVHF